MQAIQVFQRLQSTRACHQRGGTKIVQQFGRLIRDEQGIELLEFLGLFPLVLLAALVFWQFMLVGYAGVVATGAARDAARAAATRENVEEAVRNASPGFDGRRWWRPLAGYPCVASTNNPVTIEVQLEAPHVALPFVGWLGQYPRVSQIATVRCEPQPMAEHLLATQSKS